MSFQNGEKSDPGGPGLPNILQHFGGRGGKVGAYVSLRYTGSVVWVGMGGGRVQHSVMCVYRPHRGPQPHMGTYNADGGGKSF